MQNLQILCTLTNPQIPFILFANDAGQEIILPYDINAIISKSSAVRRKIRCRFNAEFTAAMSADKSANPVNLVR